MDAMGYGKPACLGHNLFVRDQVLKLVAGSNPLSDQIHGCLVYQMTNDCYGCGNPAVDFKWMYHVTSNFPLGSMYGISIPTSTIKTKQM